MTRNSKSLKTERAFAFSLSWKVQNVQDAGRSTAVAKRAAAQGDALQQTARVKSCSS